jgi:3-deoxy-manno-octulosonate cytidylyltransferase (CMP-KDO synthetase)
MRTAIVIPARYHSTRLPAKALLNATGKYLVQHVYEQAAQVRGVDDVVIATDDERIRIACESFGARAIMTDPAHPSGTDRIAEVLHSVDAEIYVNLQGDEPLISPRTLEVLIDQMRHPNRPDMATLAIPIRDEATYRNPNCVKVVRDLHGRALYFSRSPIPFVRDHVPDFSSGTPEFLHHLGLYAYRKEALRTLAALPPHPLELSEKLEQLRALGNGMSMAVGVVQHAGRGVDTPEDYDLFVAEYKRQQTR